MKKILAVILVLCMAFTLCACGDKAPEASDAPAAPAAPDATAPGTAEPAEELEPVTLSMSSHLPAEHKSQKQFELLQDKVNEILGGEYLTIDLYPSNTLGTNATMLDDLKSGVTDMGHIQVASQSSLLPYCTLFQTPGGAAFESSPAASYAFRDYLNELQPEELKDVVVLTVLSSGPGAIATNFEAHSMDDLAGHMIRATSTSAEAVALWGATPVTLEWSECYEAMRNNLVDGVYTVTGAAATANFDDVCKYQIYAPWYNDAELWCISRMAYDNLPKAMQDALIEAANWVFETYTSLEMDLSFDKDPNVERFFGNIEGIIFFPDEEVEKMSEAISGISGKVADDMTAQGYDAAGAVELAKELADKYNELYPQEVQIEAIKNMGGTILE